MRRAIMIPVVAGVVALIVLAAAIAVARRNDDPSSSVTDVASSEAPLVSGSDEGPAVSGSDEGPAVSGSDEVSAASVVGEVPAVTAAVTAPDEQLVFEHAIIDPDPPSGDDCCLDVLTVGDVDGDGQLDLVVGSEHADGLSWYRNPGDATTPWERLPIGDGDFTTDGEAADVDGDGDLDVVASAIDRNVVEWWEQTGDPTSGDGWEVHEIGPDFAHDLVVADVDRDGDLDVGAYHHDAQRIAWYQHPDDPTDEWARHVVDDRAGEGLTVADLDDDGDIDLVAGPAVYLNVDGGGSEWERTALSEDWPEQARSAVGDIDGDGRLDIVLSSPETEGPLAWFAAPDWTEHVIEPEAGFSHSLEVGDVDGDGNQDVFVGVMEWAGTKTVRVLLGDGGSSWNDVTLGAEGTHNARLVDLDGDGRLDVVGKNFQGPKAVEVWWNRTEPGAATAAAAAGPPATQSGAATDPPFEGFTYVQVDDDRDRFDDDTAFFGLAFGDLDGDGDDDIASGGYLYLDPGGDLTGEWARVDLSEQVGTTVDAMLVVDVDGDEHADLIATALPDVWWLEADAGATSWSGRRVAEIPATPYPNGQGYRTGDLDGDGRPEIVLSAGVGENEVWYLSIPTDPAEGEWPAVRVTSHGSGEDLAIGDVDDDGDADIASADVHDGGMYVAWFENAGDGEGDWERHRVGEFTGEYPDRVQLADLDGDGKLDIVVSEETSGEEPNAHVVWYRQGDDVTSNEWDVHEITEQFTTNSLDAADVDGDGDVDLSTGEHRGRLRVSLWENLGADAVGVVEWREHVVDEGKESHLGARLWDLDHDGDLELVSIAWDEPQFLHLWVDD